VICQSRRWRADGHLVVFGSQVLPSAILPARMGWWSEVNVPPLTRCFSRTPHDELATDRPLWREVLSLMEVPRAPGLFVLECFSRRVTVYSQQVRALNLVDALCGLGYLRQSKRVAVVGAGFGGITVAAALAQIGVCVSLYDAEPVPMHLQLSSAKRFLHPHIYEWPIKDINDVDAGLPVLNWYAGYANKVARDIRDSRNSIRGRAQAGRVRERFSERIAWESFSYISAWGMDAALCARSCLQRSLGSRILSGDGWH
jgi:hypothetical protein